MQRRNKQKRSSYPRIKSSILMSICNNGLLRGGVSIEINLLGWKKNNIRKLIKMKKNKTKEAIR